MRLRGRPVLFGVFATVALLIAALLWFVWLPQYRPELRAGEFYGIDVSHHQGAIDWRRVASDNISFAYIKATEGGDFIDERFAENWASTAQAGIARGAYHFFTLCTSGATQAQNFLRVVPSDPEALPPAIDLELKGNCSERPPPSTVLKELGTFLDLVEERVGDRAVLYVSDDFEDYYRVSETFERPAWVLRFLRRPERSDWQIWQVMGFAYVEGVEGRVDLDVMRSVQ